MGTLKAFERKAWTWGSSQPASEPIESPGKMGVLGESERTGP